MDFDINEFNSNFPSFEKQFNQIKINKQIKCERELEHAFNEKYKNLSYDDLIHQNNNILTNDGCRHYYHPNGNVYSYNYIKKEWMEHSLIYQSKLLKLFTI